MFNPENISARLRQTAAACESFARGHAPDLARAAQMVVETYRRQGKVLICGNGGSAAEAQHIAAELVNRMCFDRAPLPAIALATDSSVVTSIANDYDFDSIFAKQVRAHGRAGDLVWGLSTSGNSKNVILALQAGGEIGLTRLAMAGKPGSAVEAVSDLCLCVDHDVTGVIQEVHLAASHIICALVEAELFGKK